MKKQEARQNDKKKNTYNPQNQKEMAGITWAHKERKLRELHRAYQRQETRGE